MEAERDRLVLDVQHLRAQLDARTQAEGELRVILARLETTNAELAGALVMKALPPAPETSATGAEVKPGTRAAGGRWWKPSTWGRR